MFEEGLGEAKERRVQKGRKAPRKEAPGTCDSRSYELNRREVVMLRRGESLRVTGVSDVPRPIPAAVLLVTTSFHTRGEEPRSRARTDRLQHGNTTDIWSPSDIVQYIGCALF